MIDVATLGIELRVENLERSLADLKKVQEQGNKTADALEDTGKRGTQGLSLMANAAKAAAAALATLGAINAARQIIAINDEYQRLENRLGLVTKGSADLANVQSKLFKLAQDSKTPYAATASLYADMASAGEELNATQSQMLKVTGAVGASLVVAGRSASEASGAIFQLGQLFGGPIVQSQEYNALLDNMRPLLAAVAKNMEGTGGTVAGLTRLVKDGKVATSDFFAAAVKGSDELTASAQGMETTVGQALTLLENDFKMTIASADMAPVVASIESLRAALNDPDVKDGLATLASGFATATAGAIEGAAGISGFIKELAELTAAYTTGGAQAAQDRYIAGLSLIRGLAIGGDFAANAVSTLLGTGELTKGSALVDLVDGKFKALNETLKESEPLVNQFASANAPWANSIDGVVASLIPLPPALQESATASFLFMTATQQTQNAVKAAADAADAQAKAEKERKAEIDRAAKAIVSANASALENAKILERTTALMLAGTTADEAAYRAKSELAGITGALIERNLAAEKASKALADAQEAEAASIDAVIEAMESRNSVAADLKSAEDQLYYLREGATLEQARTLAVMTTLERQAKQLATMGLQEKSAEKLAQLELLRAQNANQYVADAQAAQKKWLEDGKDASAEVTASMQADFDRASDRISQSISDAIIRGGLDSTDDLIDLIANSLKARTFQIVLDPVINAAGQGINSLVTGGLSQLGGALGLGGFGASSTTGTVTTSVAAGGTYTGATSIGAAGASPTAGGLAAAAGPALFYAAAAYVGYELGSAIKGEWKTQSQDVALSITGGLVDATIETERKKKRLGRDDKNQLIVDEATRLDGVLSNTFGKIYDAIIDAGDLIGSSAGDFTFAITESIKGLEGAELDGALAGILEKASITLAGQVIPNWIAWQREGETSAQTVIRLANETAGLRESFIDLGYTMQGGREISVELGQQLAVAAGGMDRLQAGMASYYENFYSEAERQANTTGRLTASIAELGYALPASRAGFRDLVSGIDLSTEANREAYATLLSLSEVAGAYYTQLEEDAKAAAQLQFDIATAQRRAEREAAESAMRRRVEEKQAQAEAFDIAMTAIGTLDLTAQQFLENTRKGLYGNQVAIAGRNLLKDPDYDYGLSFANRQGKLTPQAVALDAVLKNITRQTDLVGTVMDLVGNRLAPQDRTADRALEGVFNVRPPREVTEAWSAANQAVVTITAQSRDLTASFDAGSISAAAYATENAALAASLDATRRQIEGFKGAYPGPFTRARNLLSSLFDQIEARVAGLQDAASEIITPIQTATAELKSMGDAFDAVADQLGLKVLSVRNYDDTYGTPAETQRYIDVTEGKYGKRYDQAVAGSEVATEFGDAIKLALAQSVGLEGTALADKSSLIAGITKGDAASLEGAYLRLTAELGKYREKGDLAYVLGYDGGGKAIGGGVATEKVGISPEEYRLLADQALKAFTGGADAISESASQWKQISESLTNYRRELDGASASRLTIEQQYLAAQTEYQSVRQLALSSDVEAAERFQSVAEAFRQASMAQFGSGGGYFADLEGIKSAVDSVVGIAGFEADLPQQQLTAQNTANGYLKTMSTDIAQLRATIETQNKQIIALTAEAAKQNAKGQGQIADSLAAQNARDRARA